MQHNDYLKAAFHQINASKSPSEVVAVEKFTQLCRLRQSQVFWYQDEWYTKCNNNVTSGLITKFLYQRQNDKSNAPLIGRDGLPQWKESVLKI